MLLLFACGYGASNIIIPGQAYFRVSSPNIRSSLMFVIQCCVLCVVQISVSVMVLEALIW